MFMFVVILLLLILLGSSSMIFLMNKGVIIINKKFFFFFFFSDFELMFNMWNFMFLLMVLLISLSVLVFSLSYMSIYPIMNFISLYLMFVISMFWLIMNNNFYWMMFGWDGLGVVSFLLIVYYMNYESSINGLFTIFQNRLGDLFFVLFLVCNLNLMMSSNLILTSGLIFLLVGAAVKSAQFPFNSWLLAAMSAPTPISSLVHSSTLVVAGVYILLQFSYCLMEYMEILKWLSMLTLVISTFGLLNESDMKKLIAYSTMSHVGLMMFMMSMGLYKITYFHLNIHAMFKSLMFMCFGFVMLSSYHSQDKRLVSYYSLNPLIKMIYFFSCMCLLGLPFFSAFFSKDFIIEKAMEFTVEMSDIFFLLIFLSVSIYYSMKLLFLYKVMFSYSMVENQTLGMVSLFIMLCVSMIMINIFISMVFSVSLELVIFKMFIYLLMMMFFLLSVLTYLNGKWVLFNKKMNFNEVWMTNVYFLDQFVYWTIHISVMRLVMLNNIKLILLMNWWVMILFVFFY